MVEIAKESIIWGLRGYDVIYPGMNKFAKWGRCSTKQAQRNLRKLEGTGVITLISRPGGKRADRYEIELEQIIRQLIEQHANPSMDLVTQIRDLREEISSRF